MDYPIARLVGRAVAVLLSLGACSVAYGQVVTERVLDEDGNPRRVEQSWSHTGLLRARDLTPFGLLRLDMLPAHTADAEEGTWTFEIQYAYQNTFILSDNVRDYLETRGIGRQPLRPEDVAQIMSFFLCI